MTSTITDKQRAILEAAARRPDGLVAPPAHLPPAPRGAVAKALLTAGLVEPAGTAAEGDTAIAWKVDGAAVLLRLTAAGRRAVGAEPREQPPGVPLGAADGTGGHDSAAVAAAAQDAPTGRDEAVRHGGGGHAADTADAAPAGPQDGAHAAPAIDAPAAAPTASTAPQRRATGLRAAAARVLAAWDDADGERAGLAEAVEALRNSMPQARAARAPRDPRTGTKQDAVLALLRRPEGASGPDIIAATSWAPHTVRGFLAGLKKRGIQVLVHERVRQVGPGKEGAKGSFTVYRVAAEPAA